MRNQGVGYQINNIFKQSETFRPGESKHEDKQAAYAALAERGAKATPSNVAAETAVHSFSYARDMKDTWHQLGQFARQELGIKDMKSLDGNAVRAFFEARIADKVSYGTWAKEAAHVGKLGDALNRLGRENDIRAAISELRPFARENCERTEAVNRAFSNPAQVVDKLSGNYATAAKIQLEGGARIHEVNRLGTEALAGISRDPHTGRAVGLLRLTETKGGKERVIQITPATYREVELAVAKDGSFRAPYGGYRGAVARASEKAGEAHRGTHSFRYCYAQVRYGELSRAGMNHEAAIQQVSWEMGHERAEITMLYLGR